MTDQSRIDQLRRRVDDDPASIAFAQLAEECRRRGQLTAAVATCRTGLTFHPEYVSARVTLGRALLALDRLDEADVELTRVLVTAPEHLAATRALADTCRRQGRLADALTHYASALSLAPRDPDLERLVSEVRNAIAEHRAGDSDTAPIGARATVAVLERWLEAIHAARTNLRA
jgi:tetratricopeptide (TPR) repeat protein